MNTTYNAICYRNKDGNEYLLNICYMPMAEVEKKVEALNANKPLKDGRIDLSNVDYFFAREANAW